MRLYAQAELLERAMERERERQRQIHIHERARARTQARYVHYVLYTAIYCI